MHSHNQSRNFRKAAYKKIWRSDDGVLKILKGNLFSSIMWCGFRQSMVEDGEKRREKRKYLLSAFQEKLE